MHVSQIVETVAKVNSEKSHSIKLLITKSTKCVSKYEDYYLGFMSMFCKSLLLQRLKTYSGHVC